MTTIDLTKELLKHALEATSLTDSVAQAMQRNSADIEELTRLQSQLTDKMETLVVFATKINNEANDADDIVKEIESLHSRLTKSSLSFSEYVSKKKKRAGETVADKVYKAFLVVFFFLVAPLSVYYLAVAPANYPMFLDLPLLIALFGVSFNIFGKLAKPYLA